MVAIKNNISKNINFVNSTLHSEKENELFAELFALMNSKSLNSEDKKLLKDVILQKTENKEYLDIDEKIYENNLLKITPEEKNESEITQAEYETAKSLIEVFYREIGIVEPANQTKEFNQNSFIQDQKFLLNKNFKTGENKFINKNKFDSNELDLELKNKNSKKVVINIFKESVPSIKIKKNEQDSKIFTENKNQNNGETFKKINQFNNKVNNPNLETTIVNKKIKKKNKQFKVSTNEKIEDNKFYVKNSKIELAKNTNIAQVNRKSGDNQLNQKREVSNKDFLKPTETKDNHMQNKGQIFLDLLESSWGEKFSRIIKNATNSGVNKLEIQVKPKNLGKLNLEVSVKNNVTAINIGSENQDVVSLLNENLPRLLESIDRESKGFSSNMNNENNNNNYFNEKKDRKDFFSKNEICKKSKKNIENKSKNLTNHNIDVNA